VDDVLERIATALERIADNLDTLAELADLAETAQYRRELRDA
jgi:hypothetical protein